MTGPSWSRSGTGSLPAWRERKAVLRSGSAASSLSSLALATKALAMSARLLARSCSRQAAGEGLLPGSWQLA